MMPKHRQYRKRHTTMYMQVFGGRSSALLLDWLQSLRWPKQSDDQSSGISWFELAVNFMVTTQYTGVSQATRWHQTVCFYRWWSGFSYFHIYNGGCDEQYSGQLETFTIFAAETSFSWRSNGEGTVVAPVGCWRFSNGIAETSTISSTTSYHGDSTEISPCVLSWWHCCFSCHSGNSSDGTCF